MKLIALMLLQNIVFPPQPNISLEVTTSDIQKPWAFIAPHENEHVVNDYVALNILQHGGVFVVLRQHGERHIQLSVNGSVYEADPNRIFTNKGRVATLRRLNEGLALDSLDYKMALSRLEALADFILSTMGAEQSSSWIAVHNNTNGYDNDGNNGRGTISIKRYQKKLEEGAQYLIKVFDAGKDEDDLFFITEAEDLAIMASSKFNTVLQNPSVATDPNEDDGSLSVLAEMKGKRYINVEAERADNDFGSDHLAEQKEMVDLTFKILTSTK